MRSKADEIVIQYYNNTMFSEILGNEDNVKLMNETPELNRFYELADGRYNDFLRIFREFDKCNTKKKFNKLVVDLEKCIGLKADEMTDDDKRYLHIFVDFISNNGIPADKKNPDEDLSKQKYTVVMWKDEELRDAGIKHFAYFDLIDLEDAKSKAQKLLDDGHAVSVEVISEDEYGERTVYWGACFDREWELNEYGNLTFTDKELTPEICMVAVKKDGLALQYVPEHLKTKKLCKIALEYNDEAIIYVPEHLKHYFEQ